MKLSTTEIKDYYDKGLLESMLLGQGMMPLEALKIVLEDKTLEYYSNELQTINTTLDAKVAQLEDTLSHIRELASL